MKFLDFERLGLLSAALANKHVGDKVLMGRIEAYSCKPLSDDKRIKKELESDLGGSNGALGATGGGLAGSLPTTHHLHSSNSSSCSNSNSINAGLCQSSVPPSLPSSFTSSISRIPPSGSGFRAGSMPTGFSSAAGGASSLFLSSSSAGTSASSPLGDLSDSATRKLLVYLISTLNAAFPDYDFSGVRSEQFLKEPDLRLVMSDVNRHLTELGDAVPPTFLEEMWAAIDEALGVTLKDCEIYSYLPDMEGDPFSYNLWSFNYFFVNRRMKRIVFFSCIVKSKYQASMEEGGDDTDMGEDVAMVRDSDDEQYWVEDI